MRRTNTIALAPTQEQSQQLHNIADACTRLWNEITYRRRQTFFKGTINWEWRDLYDIYKKVVGSATAQQIERKDNEAWRSFFALLRLKKEGRLPPNIKHIRPPGYWKDRRTNRRKLIILIRCDLYRFEGEVLHLPKKLHIKWRGNLKWTNWTKQGLLTIKYDAMKNKWYSRQPVEVEPPHQPLANRRAYIDLGVINLLTVAIEREQQTLAYSGRPALSDWWYLSKKIDRLKSLVKTTNNQDSTNQIRRLYRRRRLRFRHYVNTIVRRAVEYLWQRGCSTIVAGDLTSILSNIDGGRRTNSMTHNFWNHRYLMQRVKEVAEEYGVAVKMVDERSTSSTCPRCRSQRISHRKRLFKCKDCKLEAHRDGVGAVNIGLAQGAVFPGEVVNGAVACPLEIYV